MISSILISGRDNVGWIVLEKAYNVLDINMLHRITLHHLHDGKFKFGLIMLLKQEIMFVPQYSILNCISVKCYFTYEKNNWEHNLESPAGDGKYTGTWTLILPFYPNQGILSPSAWDFQRVISFKFLLPTIKCVKKIFCWVFPIFQRVWNQNNFW